LGTFDEFETMLSDNMMMEILPKQINLHSTFHYLKLAFGIYSAKSDTDPNLSVDLTVSEEGRDAFENGRLVNGTAFRG